MAASQNLKDLRSVWGDACNTMWVEIAALRFTQHHIISNYSKLDSSQSIDMFVYAPECRDRMNTVKKDFFLENFGNYLLSVVTGRVVILSAAFELFFSSFLSSYIRSKSKYYDSLHNKNTTLGDKLYGEVMSSKGLVGKVQKFGDAAPSKIKSISKKFPYLNDVYILRNIIAHRAGSVDGYASSELQIFKIDAGLQVVLSPTQLIQLAAPVLAVAAELDSKIS